jgi:hypothetical protein
MRRKEYMGRMENWEEWAMKFAPVSDRDGIKAGMLQELPEAKMLRAMGLCQLHRHGALFVMHAHSHKPEVASQQERICQVKKLPAEIGGSTISPRPLTRKDFQFIYPLPFSSFFPLSFFFSLFCYLLGGRELEHLLEQKDQVCAHHIRLPSKTLGLKTRVQCSGAPTRRSLAQEPCKADEEIRPKKASYLACILGRMRDAVGLDVQVNGRRERIFRHHAQQHNRACFAHAMRKIPCAQAPPGKKKEKSKPG